MERGPTGRYERTSAGGDEIQAFVPAPLPPTPPVVLASPLQRRLERALLALGRLDTLSTLQPGSDVFRSTFIRKEAVFSSRIEGTRASLTDVLLFELDETPDVPLDDVVQVSNYAAALERGFAQLAAGSPPSNGLLRETHGVLLSRGAGSGKEPGVFRRSQNWIGGARPANAVFVPPPPAFVAECMADLERFVADQEDGLPILVRAALAHAQFEIVHPFVDGNGRMGRLLIAFLLAHAGVLREPLLFLSVWFEQRREEYYRLLGQIPRRGDWEAWLAFFLDGVRETAEDAVETGRRLTALFHEDRARIVPAGRRAGSMLRVHDALMARPVISLPEVVSRTSLTLPTAGTAMRSLVALGVAREITGKRRNRVFAYDDYLALMKVGGT